VLLDKRKEDIFRDEVVKQLRVFLRAYEDVEVKPKANLWYRLQMRDNGTRDPPDEQPVRGRNAFEQDIVVVEKNNVPRVVIETKVGGCTTHEAIAYSTKAHLVKGAYPFLRYVFLIGNAARITYKLVKHGEFFDAIMALPFDPSNRIPEDNLRELVEIIESEIKTSRELGEIISGKRLARMFWKSIRTS
jgi:hypothetical protein